jgi:hypothetical protein
MDVDTGIGSQEDTEHSVVPQRYSIEGCSD